MAKKVYIDRRVTTNGRKSKLNLDNSFELGAWIDAHLLSSPSAAESLADTLLIGNATGGTGIEITNGDFITTSDTTGFIAMGAVVGGIYMDSDNAGGAEASLTLDNGSANLKFNGGGSFNTSPLQGQMEIDVVPDVTHSYMNSSTIVLQSNVTVVPASISVKPNGAAIQTNEAYDECVFINTGSNATPSQFNAGVSNSVIVGGDDITAKTNNTAYSNQISLQPSGSTFDCILKPGVLTQDTEITYPLESGYVMIQRVAEVSTTPTAVVDGQVLMVNSTTTPISLTLPSPVGKDNQRIVVKLTAGANTVTLDGGGATIDNGAYILLGTPNNFVTIVSYGDKWWVVAERNI